jgi:hypothetical protein
VHQEINLFFSNYLGEMVGAGARAAQKNFSKIPHFCTLSVPLFLKSLEFTEYASGTQKTERNFTLY